MKQHCYRMKRYKEKEGKKIQGKSVGYSKNCLVIWVWLLNVFFKFVLTKNDICLEYLLCLYSSTLLVLVLSCVKYLSNLASL